MISLWHKNRNWGSWSKPVHAKKSSLNSYAQYHYIIEGNGAIRQPRKHDEVGWHAGNWNVKSLGICLCGDFDMEKPNREQIFALRDVLRKLTKEYGIPKENILGHRDTARTACPGRNININTVRELVEDEKENLKKKLLKINDEMRKEINKL
jgi:N-acetyl-anhydromuramyl-L-alanine amidase AmpD